MQFSGKRGQKFESLGVRVGAEGGTGCPAAFFIRVTWLNVF